MYKTVDLEGLYLGSNRCCFLICPGPSLSKNDLTKLNVPGIVTVAINNAPVVYERVSGSFPTIWIGCDPPACFKPRVLLSPSMLKFGCDEHSSESLANGLIYRDCPSMFFFELTRDSHERSKMFWSGNTFMIAMQFCRLLGFQHVFLLGSEFQFDEACYAYKSSLTSAEQLANRRLYSLIVEQLVAKKEEFELVGFNLINCSGGELEKIGLFQSMSFEEAVAFCLDGYPTDSDTSILPHSSRMRFEKR